MDEPAPGRASPSGARLRDLARRLDRCRAGAAEARRAADAALSAYSSARIAARELQGALQTARWDHDDDAGFRRERDRALGTAASSIRGARDGLLREGEPTGLRRAFAPLAAELAALSGDLEAIGRGRRSSDVAFRIRAVHDRAAPLPDRLHALHAPFRARAARLERRAAALRSALGPLSPPPRAGRASPPSSPASGRS